MPAPPEVLFFRWPGAKVQGCGEFRLQAELANGMPLWRWAGTGSDKYLYSGAFGRWYISDATAKEKDFKDTWGRIASATPHGGAHPPAVQGWEWGDDTGWHKAVGLKVLTEAPAPPEVLSVRWPDAKCGGVAGEYQLQAELANGMPLWRSAGTGIDRWLYSGGSGRWYIWDAHVKEQDFQCSRGWIQSAARHGGAQPAAVHGWEHYDRDKKAWCKADNFEVLAVLTEAEAKAAEEAAKKVPGADAARGGPAPPPAEGRDAAASEGPEPRVVLAAGLAAGLAAAAGAAVGLALGARSRRGAGGEAERPEAPELIEVAVDGARKDEREQIAKEKAEKAHIANRVLGAGMIFTDVVDVVPFTAMVGYVRFPGVLAFGILVTIFCILDLIGFVRLYLGYYGDPDTLSTVIRWKKGLTAAGDVLQLTLALMVEVGPDADLVPLFLKVVQYLTSVVNVVWSLSGGHVIKKYIAEPTE